MTRNKLALSLAGLLLAPIAGTAFAQTTPAASQDQSQSQPAASQSNTKQLQTITVTGSALPRVDTETPSPVTVITAQDIARTGFTTVSDVVRSISADNSGSIPNSFYAGFAAGSSGVALRGLTVNSTLVLIDGKRSASYPLVDDGIRSFVDLNTIPLAAVERIEVLKDGASSIYGSDAIAGVVNIILKPSFQGVEGSADVGNSQHGGGFTKKATLVAGTGDLNTDHYNTYFSVEWEQDQPIRASDRSYPFNSPNWTNIGGQNTSWGNPNLNGVGIGSIWGTVAPAGTTPGGTATGPFQPLRPCGTGSQSVTVPGNGPGTGTYCQQNQISDYGYFQQKQNRGGIYGRYTYKFNDSTKAYASLSYDENKTTILGTPPQIQNSVPVNTNFIELPPTLANGQLNPNNPFAAQGQYALINYAFGDIPQQTITDDHNLRGVLDLQGTFGDWNYEASVVGNHESLDYRQAGFLSYNGLINAIQNGTYNFVNPSANSKAVLNSVAPPYAVTDTSDMDVFDFNVNRELFDLPGGPAGFAGGVQFRHEAQNELPLNPGGIYENLGSTRIIGNRNVSGIYSEFDAPLLENLEVDASGRFDHYPGVGNNFSPKVGVKWKATDWLAVRGTYSKGFRAPAFGESAGSYSAGFVNTSVAGLGASPAFLAAHGNDAYVTNPYSIEEGSSGNPNLKPEKSQSFTFGVVVQPLSWLNASLDYYNIKKSNVILPANPGTALAQYLTAGTIPAGYTMTFDAPDPLHPGAPLRPVFVGADYINGQWLKTSGLDLDLQAHFEFSNGIKYISEVQATQIFQWKEDIGGQVQSYVGTQGPYGLSSGAGTPRTRGNWANTVEYGPLSLTATVYFTSHEYESAEDITGTTACYDALGANGGPLIPNCTMASFTYGNLVGSYKLNDHVTLTASVDNVTDRKPPLDPINYAGNGYNPTYDYAGIIGRFWNVGVKVKF
ncbi:TonB-dependent receptor [Dyella psychrodurans]|uniref:TonB-dependent receptor n=1 Tax=Dyella psychrodurans TaxID=1927960 RepID=A0A370X6B2_9GAMM|nr:TonB-dependent receptor [Dyella psychrodurans]RDS83964.1 TonB-dependent receptor [Dyella psychrodurans]